MLRRLRNSWEKNWPEIHAVLTGGLPSFVLDKRPLDVGSTVPVFCYHLVDPEEFELDLRFLRRNGYATIDADTLLAHVVGERTAPRRAVVLTIDDGAVNLFDVAFPLLRRYEMKAVGFIAPGLQPDDSVLAPSTIEGTRRPCTWSEIRSMHRSGHLDFQAHTLEHRYVPRWPEPVALAGSDEDLVDSLRGEPLSLVEDFRRARGILEERLEKEVRHLAFPKYRGTSDALKIGMASGYRGFWWGYVARHKGNRAGGSPHHISRVDSVYLRRLPGEGRLDLKSAVEKRLAAGLRRSASGGVTLGHASPGPASAADGHRETWDR